MTDHSVTVIDEYRRAFTWTAGCSCGWSESYNMLAVAITAGHEHERRQSPGDAGAGGGE